jgi:cytochrome c biogenesis protein CcdA
MAITDFLLTLKIFYFLVIVSALFLLRKRNGKNFSDRKFVLMVATAFLLIYVLNAPQVFGRCPVPSQTPTFKGTSEGWAGFAFGATSGLITFLSPCGLPPLPAYIRYFLGAKSSRERAISLSFLAASGFLFVIAAFAVAFVLLRGYFVTPFQYSSGISVPIPRLGYGSLAFSSSNATVLDILGYAAGAVSMLMGALMLLRIRIPFFKERSLGSFNRGVKSVFLFSIGWGTANITCSPYAVIPLILYVLVYGGYSPFIGFAAGMMFPVLLVSLLLGFGKGGLVERMVRTSTKYQWLAGTILVITGIYIIVYTLLNPATGTKFFF